MYDVIQFTALASWPILSQLPDMIALITSHESILTGNPSDSIIETLSRERDTYHKPMSLAISWQPDIP